MRFHRLRVNGRPKRWPNVSFCVENGVVYKTPPKNHALNNDKPAVLPTSTLKYISEWTCKRRCHAIIKACTSYNSINPHNGKQPKFFTKTIEGKQNEVTAAQNKWQIWNGVPCLKDWIYDNYKLYCNTKTCTVPRLTLIGASPTLIVTKSPARGIMVSI